MKEGTRGHFCVYSVKRLASFEEVSSEFSLQWGFDLSHA